MSAEIPASAAAAPRPGHASLSSLDRYDEIIDVRSPAEFAEDHIPGAISCPVLDDAQRARVGTLYKQVSPFEAKKLGASLIAGNIARHLEERFLDRPRHWRPLVYCWRGGMRSGALVTVLRSVGWNAGQLEGGYKAYRRQVVEQLEQIPAGLRLRVLCGATGSAKTRTLQALASRGLQVIDLEALACHKGSVLGVLPGTPQPTQKAFESELLAALSRLDPALPVHIEAESRKIGRLQVPESLIQAMRAGECLVIDAPVSARVDFLLRDYDYFTADPAWLETRLGALRGLLSNEILARWNGLAAAGSWPELVGELLTLHYDPLYERSQGANYAGYSSSRRFTTDNLNDAGISDLAQRIALAD